MKWKEIKYTIVEQNNDYFVRKDWFYLGCHWLSEVIEDYSTGRIRVFGSKEEAEEYIRELGGKGIKKKIKLLCK